MSISYWFAKDNPDKLVDLFIQNIDRELQVRIVNRLTELRGIKQLTALYQKTSDRAIAEVLVKLTSTPQTLRLILTNSSDKDVQVLALNHLKDQREWKVIAGCLGNKQLDPQVRHNIISLLLQEDILSPDEICNIAISSNEAVVHQITIEKLITISDTGSLTILLDANNISMPIKTSVFNALTSIYLDDADKLKNLFGKSLNVSQRAVIVDRLLEVSSDHDLIQLLNHDNLESELFSKIDDYLFEKSKTDAESLAELYLTFHNKNIAIKYVDQLCSSGDLNSLIKVLNSENVPADHYIKIALTVCSSTDDTAILSALYHQAEPGTIQDQIISRFCDIKADKALIDLLGSTSLSSSSIREITGYFLESKQTDSSSLLYLYQVVSEDAIKLRVIDKLAELKAVSELKSIKEKRFHTIVTEHLVSLANMDNELLVEIIRGVNDKKVKQHAVDALIKNNAIPNLWELKSTEHFDYIITNFFSNIYRNKAPSIRVLCLSALSPEARFAVVSKTTAKALSEIILGELDREHQKFSFETLPIDPESVVLTINMDDFEDWEEPWHRDAVEIEILEEPEFEVIPELYIDVKTQLHNLVVDTWYWVFYSVDIEIGESIFQDLVQFGLEKKNYYSLMLAYKVNPLLFKESVSKIETVNSYNSHTEGIETKYLDLIKTASNRSEVEHYLKDKEEELAKLFDARLFSFCSHNNLENEIEKEWNNGDVTLVLQDVLPDSVITDDYFGRLRLIDDKLEEQIKGCRDVDKIMQAKTIAESEKNKIIDSDDIIFTLYESDETNDIQTFETIVSLAVVHGSDVHRKAALFRIWSSSDSKWVVFLMKNLKHFKQYPDELLISISNKSSPYSSYNSVALLLSIENVITDKQLWNDVFYHNLKLIRENANKNHIVALSSLIKQFQKGNPILGALEILQYRICRESDQISINNDNNPDSVDIQVKK